MPKFKTVYATYDGKTPVYEIRQDMRTGLLENICLFCGQSFKTKTEITKHIRIHELT